MMKTKLIALAAAALALTASAEIDPDWLQNQQRLAAIAWVQDQAQKPLTESQAATVVDTTWFEAGRHDLDPQLVLAVMRVESGFVATAHGRGSKGLMQVQTGWHRDKLGGRSPYDAAVSIEVGTTILADCWQRHPGLQPALRCYNGGGDRHYVTKVQRVWQHLTAYSQGQVFDAVMQAAAQLN